MDNKILQHQQNKNCCLLFIKYGYLKETKNNLNKNLSFF